MTEHESENFKINDRRGQDTSSSSKTSTQEATPKTGTPKTGTEVKSDPTPDADRAQPSIDFSTFVLSLSTSALVHLGFVEDPHSGQKNVNLGMAKQEIDIIDMLNAKTDGNRTQEEDTLLSQVLYELRMRYLEASKTPPSS